MWLMWWLSKWTEENLQAKEACTNYNDFMVAGKRWLQALKLFVVFFLAPGRCLREKSLRGNMGLLYCHNELDFRSQSCVKTNACDTSHTKLMNIPLTTLLGFSLAPRHQGIL